jgi:hypothetical protein
MASIKVTREVNLRAEVTYWVYQDEKPVMCYTAGLLYSNEEAREKALQFAAEIKANPLLPSIEIIAEY